MDNSNNKNVFRRCVYCDKLKKRVRVSDYAICDTCEDYLNNKAEREKEDEFDAEFNSKRFTYDNLP